MRSRSPSAARPPKTASPSWWRWSRAASARTDLAMRRAITGFSNPTVKLLRSLRDKKHRRREGKFLAEGLRLLTDARESGRLPEMLVMAEGRDPHPLLDELESEVASAGG